MVDERAKQNTDTEGEKLNLGPKDFTMGPNKSEAPRQKDWLTAALPKAHKQWMAQLPDHLKPHAVGQGTWRKWQPWWKMPHGKRKRSGCGCVHHESCSRAEAGVRAGRAADGSPMHRSKRRRLDGGCCALTKQNTDTDDTQGAH